MNLTAKQLEIVRFIWKYRKTRGISPTLSEIASVLGVSKITVHEHVSILERKKALTKEKYQSRSLNLTPEVIELLEETERQQKQEQGEYSLPLLGYIAAGQPIEALEQAEEVDLSDMVNIARSSYVLRVKGESMIDEGIRDGDYVIVERRATARNGEMVVAIVDGGDATLKKFYREGDRIRLQPANEAMEPIWVASCEVRGVVVGVMRRYT